MAKRNNEQITEERGLERLTANALRWIKIVALILGLSVTFLELKDAPLDGFTRSFDNSSLMKIGMVIFFFGWLSGTTHDTELQREGYCRDRGKGAVGGEEIAGIVVFLAVFSALFVLHDDLVWFQAALFVFLLVNVWTWQVIFRRTKEMIEASYEQFTSPGDTRDNCSLAKLLVVVQYMNGPWQRRRFISLILLAGLQLLAAVLLQRGMLAPLAGDLKLNGVPAAVLINYLPGALFILYVLVSEIWMKVYRIKAFSDLATIDYLEEHFAVSKRRDAPPPAPHLARLTDFSPTPNQNYVGHGPLDWFINAT